MSELLLKASTFLLIRDTRIFAVRDQDLRFTLAHLIYGDRKETRAYISSHLREEHFCSYMADMSRARITGFCKALFAVQTARNLARAMKREIGVGEGRAGHGRRVGAPTVISRARPSWNDAIDSILQEAA